MSRAADTPARRSLAGRRIAITRAGQGATELTGILEQLGARVLVRPAITIDPPDSWAAIDAALRDIWRFEWMVCTSANAVRAVSDRWRAVHGRLPFPSAPRVAAVGGATALALRELLRVPDFVPRAHDAAALADTLDVTEGGAVLFPCGDLALPAVPARLASRGARVERVVVYRTMRGDGAEIVARELADRELDAVLFASPSAVAHVVDALVRLAGAAGAEKAFGPGSAAAVCIGAVTARAAAEAGIAGAVVSRGEQTGDLIAALHEGLAIAKRSEDA